MTTEIQSQEYQGAARQAAPTDAVVTESRLQKAFRLVCGAIAKDVVSREYALQARIDALEQKVRILEEVPGALAIAAVVDRLEKTLSAPVVPKFDADGRLVSAQRISPGASDADARLKRVEATLASLRNVPRLKYCGIWNGSREYEIGDFVTHSGSCWHANALTRERPGDGSPSWTLAVKRGSRG